MSAEEFQRSVRQTPVEIGKEYTGVIESFGRKGDAIVRIDNFVVFVKCKNGTNDKIKFRITGIGKSSAFAELA